MKRMSFGLAVLIALSACTVEKPYKSGLEELSFTSAIEARVEDNASSPETKTYLDQANGEYQIHWNEGDAISIFFDTYNGKYLFANSTGSTAGRFNPASTESGSPFTTGLELERYYSIYPYAESTSLSAGVISFEFPATQTYAENSFGQGAGVMSAVTSGSTDTHLSFKNVTGYLKLFVYGGAKVQSIVLTGKNEEKLSGPAQITAVYGEAPVTVMTGSAASVTLECGGVQTGATEEEATVFYIAIPPTEFTQGFTVEITDTEGRVMTKSTSSLTAVNRNRVKPMPAFKFEGVAPEPPEPEIPDLLVVDSGLPILYVFTPDGVPVDQKETWIAGSQAYLKNTDGTIDILGSANIRGRGNTTWNQVKKPYAFKLDTKTSLLGMPADKRWDLLANFLDRTRLRNDLAFELGRRLVENGVIENWWTPKGEYVELVLNNELMGNYYLCEHIKISKNRVNIKEMKTTDIDEETITGGYLMECGIEMDEGDGHQFWTNYFTDVYPYNRHGKSNGKYHIPVMIKSPEDIVPEQFNWIQNRINSIQGHIINNNGGWVNEVDIDSFICWMFIQECVSNYEPFHPKSAYMHMDRGGKLVMGPLWDFDYGTFDESTGMTPIYHYTMWYPYMLNNATFKARVNELWPSIKATLREVCNEYATKYTQSYANEHPEIMALAQSIDRDYVYWKNKNGGTMNNVNGDESMGIWNAFKRLTDNLSGRISQMGTESGLFN